MTIPPDDTTGDGQPPEDASGWSDNDQLHGIAPLAGVIGTLVVSNVMANQVLPDWAYVPWNCTIAATVITIAVRRDGLNLAEMGLSRDKIPNGLRWGLGLSAGMLAIYAIGFALPPSRELFLDDRADVGSLELATKVFINVPLGTVLLEEVSFRGVLPAMFHRRLAHLTDPRRRRFTADAMAAGLFGLWHVLPAWDINSANPVFRDTLPGPFGRAAAITGGVAGTAVAGMVFSWLRNRSDSVVAPASVHATSNGVGYLIAWLTHRL